jgi:hypothetical protein
MFVIGLSLHIKLKLGKKSIEEIISLNFSAPYMVDFGNAGGA